MIIGTNNNASGNYAVAVGTSNKICETSEFTRYTDYIDITDLLLYILNKVEYKKFIKFVKKMVRKKKLLYIDDHHRDYYCRVLKLKPEIVLSQYLYDPEPKVMSTISTIITYSLVDCVSTGYGKISLHLKDTTFYTGTYFKHIDEPDNSWKTRSNPEFFLKKKYVREFEKIVRKFFKKDQDTVDEVLLLSSFAEEKYFNDI